MARQRTEMPCNRISPTNLLVASMSLAACCPVAASSSGRTWQECMVAWPTASAQAKAQAEQEFPVEWDWLLQDSGKSWKVLHQSGALTEGPADLVRRVLAELGEQGDELNARFDALGSDQVPATDRRWWDLYMAACRQRRKIRLGPLTGKWSSIVFTKHFNMGGSHYAYTEGQSDAQNERQFVPGTALCLLELNGDRTRVRTLIEDANGVIRDPDVSYDGKRILFAWKKSDRKDDYHLYEMNIETGSVRQLTFGLGFADYEAAYLPSGDIVFNSTRCVQTVDCWWTEVSNLYTCDKDGKYLRRLSFDQVHSNFPTVMDNGRVIYTRWEYSDRGQIYTQPLYQMNADGTGQTEFYGNNSWFPTALLHSRNIPGTSKVLSIASGHHTRQTGKLCIVDPGKGRQENAGVQLVAPVRKTGAVRVDAYGQNGDLFQYPYPLSETEYLVTYAPFGWTRKPVWFGIYFMTADGRRELLVADSKISCNQPVPLAPRHRPHVRPSVVDYGKKTGTYFVQDVHSGPGLAGVPRGTVKRLRVIALEYRAAGIRSNRNGGPAGGALISTPVAIDNGCWDVKVVLGDAKVYQDGSACFTVPARTPVYFQAIDAAGHSVQTMRSWSTLQPGEYYSCVGCHERKSDAPPMGAETTMAMRAGPKPLEPFHGPARGFSFVREVQPILDRHCVRCHKWRGPDSIGVALTTASHANPADSHAAMHDRREPKHSSDRKIPRFTWWDHKGTREWVRYGFEKPTTVSGVEVYWFDDRPGGGCRVPAWWRVLYQDAGSWKAVAEATEYHCDRNKYNVVSFRPVKTTALRLVVRLQGGYSGGILEWRAIAAPPTVHLKTKAAFSLLGLQTPEKRSGRKWSDAYVALTRNGESNPIVNWISAQSVPSMLPPYHAGAARSGLVSMLAKGHNDVKLSREEADKIACWIDLLVPYCGDYTEANAWTPDEVAKYDHFTRKRAKMAEMESKNIEALMARRAAGPDVYGDL